MLKLTNHTVDETPEGASGFRLVRREVILEAGFGAWRSVMSYRGPSYVDAEDGNPIAIRDHVLIVRAVLIALAVLGLIGRRFR